MPGRPAMKVTISLAPSEGRCAWYTLRRTPSLTQKAIGPVWKMKCLQLEQVLILPSSDGDRDGRGETKKVRMDGSAILDLGLFITKKYRFIFSQQ